jgi:predicted RNase H-like nuclease (RuvC/YqgF family)
VSAAVWGPIVAALLGGGFVQIIISIAGRKKTDAEATNLIAEAAERIVGRLEAEVVGLREETEKMHKEIANLSREITVLRQEVRRLGGDPDQLVRKWSQL